MNEWKRSLLTGTIVALASQLYWNVFVSGFRISPAVILLPILLMTIGKSISTIQITVTTAAVVFLFRLFLAASGLSSPFSVVVLGKFRRFLLVIFLSLFLHLDFSFIYSKFSMPFWGFFY